MKITLLGTGGALPPSGRAQSGILLEKDHQLLLVDCGGGILLRLAQAGIGLDRVNAILISHHHLDHMSEVLPLITARWLAGHIKTRVYGPAGTAKLVADQLQLFPYVHERAHVEAHDVEPGESVSINGFRIKSMAVSHWIPTLAYKFDDLITYSADTEPMAAMADFSQGCQMLIHECSTPDGIEMPFHTMPAELGKLLKKSNVRKLVLTHFYPPLIGREREAVASIKRHFAGDIILGEDLASFEL